MLRTLQYITVIQSRKLKSRYGARNRFQEPSLELSSKATLAGGPVRQPYAYLVPSPHSWTKVTDTVQYVTSDLMLGVGGLWVNRIVN